MMDHTPCQCAVRGHHRHSLFRLLKRLAHQNGDGLSLFLGRRCLHQAHAVQLPLIIRHLGPNTARLRRQKHGGNGRPARITMRRRNGGLSAAGPNCHFLTGNAHALEQQFEMILWMSNRILAAKTDLLAFSGGGSLRAGLARSGPSIRPVFGSGQPQFLPYVIAETNIEIRQDHRPLRQECNFAHQPRNRRGRAGHTGCNNRRGWRRTAPLAG